MKEEAIKKWAEIYGRVLLASGFAGTSFADAVAFGVADMCNQTRGMGDSEAAFLINDDADWMAEKLAKAAA